MDLRSSYTANFARRPLCTCLPPLDLVRYTSTSSFLVPLHSVFYTWGSPASVTMDGLKMFTKLPQKIPDPFNLLGDQPKLAFRSQPGGIAKLATTRVSAKL